MEYKDIYKDAVEKGLSCATQVPYFEGDFWPNVLEESIRVSNSSLSGYDEVTQTLTEMVIKTKAK